MLCVVLCRCVQQTQDSKDACGASPVFKKDCRDHVGKCRKAIATAKALNIKLGRAVNAAKFQSEIDMVKEYTDNATAALNILNCMAAAKPEIVTLSKAFKALMKIESCKMSVTFHAAHMWMESEHLVSQQRYNELLDTLRESKTTELAKYVKSSGAHFQPQNIAEAVLEKVGETMISSVAAADAKKPSSASAQ